MIKHITSPQDTSRTIRTVQDAHLDRPPLDLTQDKRTAQVADQDTVTDRITD